MSLVGPRPHALGSRAGGALFWDVDRRYWYRHATKPGLTGLAQVRGYRGATDHHSDLTHRLTADLEYLSGWTLWRDITILFLTARSEERAVGTECVSRCSSGWSPDH